MVTSWNGSTSTWPVRCALTRPDEVGDAQEPVALLPRESEPESFGRIGSRFVEHDDVVALRHRGEVPVHHRGVREDAVGGQPVQPVAQPRASLGLDQVLVRRGLATAHAAQPPLPQEQRPLVEQAGVLGHRDTLDHPGAPERRNGHLNVGGDVGPLRHLDGRLLGFAFGGNAFRPFVAGLALGLLFARRDRLGAVGVGRLAALGAHDGVHQLEALERVARVMHFALIDVGQVVLDVAAGERRSAEQHREPVGDPAGVHLLEVFLHHHGGLHQQAGHADHVGVLVLGHVEDVGDRLLDADVDDLVAVVGQDDVDEVLADVVHVALDRRQHDAALAASSSACSMCGSR